MTPASMRDLTRANLLLHQGVGVVHTHSIESIRTRSNR